MASWLLVCSVVVMVLSIDHTKYCDAVCGLMLMLVSWVLVLGVTITAKNWTLASQSVVYVESYQVQSVREC